MRYITPLLLLAACRSGISSDLNALLDRRGREVSALLSSSREPPPLRLLDAELTAYGGVAECSSAGIFLARAGLRDVDTVVTHELVHWHAPAGLPPVLEEGIAEWISRDLCEGGFANDAILVERPERFLTLTDQEMASLSHDDRLEVAWAGYWLVEKMGLERALATRR